MSVTYHESQVTFYKEKEVDLDKLEEKLESCKKLIGKPTYSDVTGKTGKISSVFASKGNIYLGVEVLE